MTPFRDFGSESLPAGRVVASKLRTECNWVQALEGNIDTSHISFLHTFNAIDDLPDDGTDRPGYSSDWTSMKFRRHDRAPRLEVVDEHYGFRYVGLRTTPGGHTHARVSAYVIPYGTCIASIPFSAGHLLTVPIDDRSTWRYSCATPTPRSPRHASGTNWRLTIPNYPFRGLRGAGVTPSEYRADNDYQIDREAQRTSSFTGVPSIVGQDIMVTESMGPIYDRPSEHLGTTDVAVIRMRGLLLNAARALAEGEEPPAVSAEVNYRDIRGAEKVLEPGEDWRVLGTDEDPMVRAAWSSAEAAPV
jgi:hypothetical protein